MARLFARTKTYSIGAQLPEDQKIKVDITPLSLEDQALLKKNEGESDEERMMKLIAKSTGWSHEDIKRISVEYVEELTNCILEANNLLDPDVQAKIKEAKIAKAQKDIEGL